MIWVSRILPVLMVLAALAGCTRPQDSEVSRVTILAPDEKQVLSKVGALSAFPSGARVCYGVSVSGPGIGSTGNSCSGNLGAKGGFIGSGGELTLEVPRGVDRKILLFAHLTDPAAACPSWDSAFHSNGANYHKTYLVGSAEGVSTQSDTTDVAISVFFDGILKTVASQNQPESCVGISGGSGTLRGLLYTDGTLVKATSPNVASVFLPIANAFFELIGDFYSSDSIILVGDSGSVAADAAVYPPYLHSFARKPDSGKIYALTEDNLIVQLSAGVFETPSTCPFNVVGCKLPVWVQSMSPGMGSDLFALDHGGTIYQATGASLETTGTTVLPSVVQVSYY